MQNSSNLQHTPSILAKKNCLHVGICICILQVWHKELISKATPLFVFVFMWSLIIQTSSFYLRKYQRQWFAADRAYSETFWWAIFLFKLSGSHVHQVDFLVVWRKNTLAGPYQPLKILIRLKEMKTKNTRPLPTLPTTITPPLALMLPKVQGKNRMLLSWWWWWW